MAGRCARSRCGKSSDGERAMILGTAGHIDHGKTALVRALTGVDTDRLPEEKRRGITIDLGFAPLQLNGRVIGVVDVPGHEAFVRTMVAGATGIDVALVVVAADAGVMPQTREHLSILSLLGVERGIVVLTKCDLADEEWLALVEEDVRATLDRSSLASAPIIRTSVVTHEGLDVLRAEIEALSARYERSSEDDLFRLPIDRAFTVKGTGTVVTGTVWSGALAKDEIVRLFPGDHPVRVRNLQAHGHDVPTVSQGDRAAIALSGVPLEAVHRGAVLVRGPGWTASRVIRAELSLLPSAPTIGPRTRVRFHTGTSDVGARIVRTGDSSSVRIVLDEPIVARTRDRFVIRSASPLFTVGGGIITDSAAPLRARPRALDPQNAAALLDFLADEAGVAGVERSDLPVRLGVSPARANAILKRAGGRTVGTRYVGAAALERLSHDLLATVEQYHREHPLEGGAPLQWLRAHMKASDEVASALVDSHVHAGAVTVANGVVARAGFSSSLSTSQATQAEEVLDLLERSPSEPPNAAELASHFRYSPAKMNDLLRWLCRAGRIVAVESDRYYSTAAVAAFRRKLSDTLEPNREYTPSDLREVLGMTRKFLIPFLEYCDREGITKRGDTGRRLAT